MHTERFTDRASAYTAGRPSYPPESVDALLEGLGDPASLAVADLGAGTGISSRVIAARGPQVFAIEPNAAMRAAAAADPRITWIDGTAERTTLGAASVDVVAAFQAWHWVDHPAAVAEARRIAKRPGRLAVVYNERDESDPFTARYGALVRTYAIDETEGRRAHGVQLVEQLDPARTLRREFKQQHVLDRAGIHARMDSTSYVPHEGPAAHALRRDLDRLLDDFEITDRVAMHLVTIVVRVDL